MCVGASTQSVIHILEATFLWPFYLCSTSGKTHLDQVVGAVIKSACGRITVLFEVSRILSRFDRGLKRWLLPVSAWHIPTWTPCPDPIPCPKLWAVSFE